MSSNSPTDPPVQPTRFRRFLDRAVVELKAPRKAPLPPGVFRFFRGFRSFRLRRPGAGAFRRFAIRASFVLACLATLVVALYLEERIRGRAAWRAYEIEAKARGVKLDFADYLPPKIPDSENFASIPLFDAVFRAAEANQPLPNPLKLREWGVRMPEANDPAEQRPLDLTAWQKFFVESKLLPAASDDAARDVLRALERFAEPLAQLREAGKRPHCRFPVSGEMPFANRFSYFQIFVSAAQLNALRLSAHLALGDSAAAYEDFRDGLRLTTATTAEPTLLPGMLRVFTAMMMENALWGGLANHRWAEPELRKIEADLASLDWLRDAHFSLNSERGAHNHWIDLAIQNPQQLFELSTRVKGASIGSFVLYPTGWLYQTNVRSNRYFDEALTRIDPIHRRYLDGPSVTLSPKKIRGPVGQIQNFFLYSLVTHLEDRQMRFVQAATLTDQARIACAVERFHFARGVFPEALSELVPDFLPAVPVEIRNGKPYRYRRTDNGGFFLASSDLDLRDDGTVRSLKESDRDQPDCGWVWRYPLR